MAERVPRQQAAARRALHETLLQQVRLDDFFDDVALVAERCCDRLDPDRTAPIIFGNAAQVTPVHAVETAYVDIEPQQRRVGGHRVDARQTCDGGKVANAAQQAYRDARGAPRPARYLGGAVGEQLDAEHPRRSAHDRPELLRLVEDEAQRNAETLPQRPRDKAGVRGRANQGEGRETVANRSRTGPLPDDQIDLVVLHRRVEVFLGRRRQTMDLVDEQHLARGELA